MTLVLLLLIPPGAGLLCLATNSRVWWERLNLAAFTLVAGLALLVAGNVATQGTISALDGFLRADALSALVLGLTGFVSLVCAIYAVGYFRREASEGRVTHAQLRHYYVLTPLFVGAMLLVPLADNLGVMWVATESTTLASVLLVTFYNQKTSFEAGWKYIIIGSVGLSLALFGTVFTYYAAVGVLGPETRGGMNWSVLAGVGDKLNPQAMRLMFILVLLGYGTKAGLAPMHTWKPDAYAEAPVPCWRRNVSVTNFPANCWGASASRPFSWPRRLSWCKEIFAGCWPIRALTTPASWWRGWALAASWARWAPRCTWFSTP